MLLLHLRIFFLVALIPWLHAVPQEAQTHPVRFFVESPMQDPHVELLCVPNPPAGLKPEEWQRRVGSTEPQRFPLTLGQESVVHLPEGEWLVWVQGRLCGPSSKRLIRMPRSRPDFVVRFWLANHQGVSGRVVDEEGKGVPGAEVLLFRWDHSLRCVTRANGTFEIGEWEKGRYDLKVQAPGMAEYAENSLRLTKLGGPRDMHILLRPKPALSKSKPAPTPIRVHGILLSSWDQNPDGQETEATQVVEELRFQPMNPDGMAGKNADWSQGIAAPLNPDGTFEVLLPRIGDYWVHPMEYVGRMLCGDPIESFSVAIGASPGQFKASSIQPLGHPWRIAVGGDLTRRLELRRPKGSLRIQFLKDGEPKQVWRHGHTPSTRDTVWHGPEMVLKSSMPWMPTWPLRSTKEGVVEIQGLAEGTYILAPNPRNEVAARRIVANVTMPEPIEIEIAQEVAALTVHLTAGHQLDGAVQNPSLSLQALPDQDLAVFAWLDPDRQRPLGHAPLNGSPQFRFASLPEGIIYLSVENLSRKAGFRGPVVPVEISGKNPPKVEILIP